MPEAAHNPANFIFRNSRLFNDSNDFATTNLHHLTLLNPPKNRSLAITVLENAGASIFAMLPSLDQLIEWVLRELTLSPQGALTVFSLRSIIALYH